MISNVIKNFVFKAKAKAKNLQEKQGQREATESENKALRPRTWKQGQGQKTRGNNQEHPKAAIRVKIIGFSTVKSQPSTGFQFCAQTVGNNKQNRLKSLVLWLRTLSQEQDQNQGLKTKDLRPRPRTLLSVLNAPQASRQVLKDTSLLTIHH